VSRGRLRQFGSRALGIPGGTDELFSRIRESSFAILRRVASTEVDRPSAAHVFGLDRAVRWAAAAGCLFWSGWRLSPGSRRQRSWHRCSRHISYATPLQPPQKEDGRRFAGAQMGPAISRLQKQISGEQRDLLIACRATRSRNHSANCRQPQQGEATIRQVSEERDSWPASRDAEKRTKFQLELPASADRSRLCMHRWNRDR